MVNVFCYLVELVVVGATDINHCKLCVCKNTGSVNRKGRAELCSVFPVKQEVSRVRLQKCYELLL